jgi:hypothetical protein
MVAGPVVPLYTRLFNVTVGVTVAAVMLALAVVLVDESA